MTIDTQIARGSSPFGLVYVAGYGRSGSTLLDSVLNEHPAVFGAGEAMWLFHHLVRGLGCSCGESLVACPFWGQVLHHVVAEVGHDDWRWMEQITVETEKLISFHRNQREYVRIWNAVFKAVYAQQPVRWIVDSSKCTHLDQFRMKLFANELDFPVKLIHLVRDPRAVMWSVARGSNRKLEQGKGRSIRSYAMAKGLASWSYSNLAIEAMARMNPQWQVLRIRYEDLVGRNEETLGQLGSFLQIDMSTIVRRIANQESFSAGHGIAGNRMRRSGQILLRLDREWEAELTRPARIYSKLAWPLLRRYQY